jgi:hypothetical protein
MASSQSSPPSDREEQKIQFRMLDKIYTISKGYKYVYIPFDELYKEPQANNEEEQEPIRKSFEYLFNAGLVDSKAIGYGSITLEGMREYESAILGYPDNPTRFPLNAIAEVATESKKNEIKTIKSQRRAFLGKAYELSRGSSTELLSSFDIGNMLGYDQKTIERIYFYFQDEGVIKPFATGGKFTITNKGIEQVKKEGNH